MDNELKELTIYSMVEGSETFIDAYVWACEHLDLDDCPPVNADDMQAVIDAVCTNLYNHYGDTPDYLEALKVRSIQL